MRAWSLVKRRSRIADLSGRPMSPASSAQDRTKCHCVHLIEESPQQEWIVHSILIGSLEEQVRYLDGGKGRGKSDLRTQVLHNGTQTSRAASCTLSPRETVRLSSSQLAIDFRRPHLVGERKAQSSARVFQSYGQEQCSMGQLDLSVPNSTLGLCEGEGNFRCVEYRVHDALRSSGAQSGFNDFDNQY